MKKTIVILGLISLMLINSVLSATCAELKTERAEKIEDLLKINSKLDQVKVNQYIRYDKLITKWEVIDYEITMLDFHIYNQCTGTTPPDGGSIF